MVDTKIIKKEKNLGWYWCHLWRWNGTELIGVVEELVLGGEVFGFENVEFVRELDEGT